MKYDLKIEYIDGVKVTILKKNKNYTSKYKVEFYDNETGHLIYQTFLKRGYWAKPINRYYIKWKIKVFKDDKLYYEETLDLENKKVLIEIRSKALGDTLCWVPYFEDFQKKHNCILTATTFRNELFKNSYPNVNFQKPEDISSTDFYATYKIGIYSNLEDHPVDWRLGPLQTVCTNILGLKYYEKRPKLDFIPSVERPLKQKYITFAPFTTFKIKHWNLENGWHDLLKYIESEDIKTVQIGAEKNFVTDFSLDGTTTDYQKVVDWIYHSEYHIGLSSGLSFVAWALGKDVVLISNFTAENAEMESNVCRVMNKGFCHSQFNNPFIEFQRDFNWNPCNDNFISSKAISAEMVFAQIKQYFRNKKRVKDEI